MTYELNGIPVEGIERGTNLLVIGPSMTGKYELGLDIVKPDGGQKAIMVTTTKSADEALADYPGDGSAVTVVDSVTEQRGDDKDHGSNVLYASSPTDLTGIGVKFSDTVEDMYDDASVEGIRVFVENLSTVLTEMDVQTVFRFLHVFTRQIKNIDGVGVYVVDSDAHDEQDLSKIRQVFDGVVYVRDDGSGTEMRVEGVGSAPTDWTQV